VFGVAVQAGAAEAGGDVVVGEGGEHGLADGRAVGVDAAADLGEHPHRVLAGALGDVDDVVAVEEGEVGGLAEGVDEPGEGALGAGACHAVGDAAERGRREPRAWQRPGPWRT
jgi:hypothetical protein